jgi:hypothetical protein
MLSRNVGSCVPVYVLFYPRRIKSSYIGMFILIEITVSNTGSADLSVRRGFAVARLLRMQVQFPPRTWMFVFCVLLGTRFRVEPITRPEDFYRVWSICDRGASTVRKPWPTRRCCTVGKSWCFNNLVPPRCSEHTFQEFYQYSTNWYYGNAIIGFMFDFNEWSWNCNFLGGPDSRKQPFTCSEPSTTSIMNESNEKVQANWLCRQCAVGGLTLTKHLTLKSPLRATSSN